MFGVSPRGARRRLPDLLLGLGMLGALALWSSTQVELFEHARSGWAHDLAFFHQILWSAAHGGPWASPILLEPQGFWSMVHFHPMLVPLVGLYALLDPSPRLLLVLNVAMVVSAAWPLSRLGREASGHAWFGALAGCAWLAWLPVSSAALADFRPMALFVPGFAWLALWAWTGRWRSLILGAALVCCAREEAGYLLMAFGAVLAAVPVPAVEGWRWRWRQGLAVAGFGLGFFLFLLAFKDNLFFHFDPGKLGQGSPTAPELLEVRRGWFLRAWLSGYVLAPLGLPLFVESLPSSLAMYADGFREWERMTGPYVHLRSAWLPLFAAAGTAGAGWLARRHRALPWVLGLAMIGGNALSFWPQRESLKGWQEQGTARIGTPEQQALEGLLAAVRPEDRVATNYDLVALLAGREVLWNTVHMNLEDGPPPHWTGAWPLTVEAVDVLVVAPDDPVLPGLGEDWILEREGGGYQLWRRGLD